MSESHGPLVKNKWLGYLKLIKSMDSKISIYRLKEPLHIIQKDKQLETKSSTVSFKNKFTKAICIVCSNCFQTKANLISAYLQQLNSFKTSSVVTMRWLFVVSLVFHIRPCKFWLYFFLIMQCA